MELNIKLDTDKLLDHVIFMLITAREKCFDGCGLLAEPRIAIALKELDNIDAILSNLIDYPSVEKLKELKIL